MNWISVKDRLPDGSGRYLVCVRLKYLYFPEIAVYSANLGIFMTDTMREYEGVTHWMPLPEPPEGGEINA